MKDRSFTESGWFMALVFGALALLALAFFIQVSKRGSPATQPRPMPRSASLPQ